MMSLSVQVQDTEILLGRLGAHDRLCAWLPLALANQPHVFGSPGIAEQLQILCCRKRT